MKSNLKILRLTTAAFAGCILLVSVANAMPIQYDYVSEVTDCPFGDPAGPCGTPGSPGPIFVGSQITGFVIIDSAAVASGAAAADNILDFFFDVAGVFPLSPAGGQTVAAGTELLFDTVGNFIGGLFELTLPNLAGPGIDGLLADQFGADGMGKWQISIPAFGGAFVNGGVSRLARSVPEPSTLALLGIGLAGIGFARRRKRS